MKIIYSLLFLLASNAILAQITYVDNFDGVYPMSSSSTFNFDINNDGQNDLRLWRYSSTSLINCSGVGSNAKYGTFRGITNTFGLNLVNGNGNGIIGVDCTNDTLNILDTWSEYSELFKVTQFPNGVCDIIGFGTHKQGFRIIMTNPANGALGYKYGYLDYTLASTGDIIIHGWYYENTFNVPIVANSQLDYPYDGNCIHYDTVMVYDTITTTIYDTITTQVFDTVLVSVTDTLYIETTLSTAPLTQNTISVFPNPTNDHITIHTGNFAVMPNYSIKIENSLGQVVFTNPLNQQTFYIDLTGWSGNGIYYLKLLDAQSNEVTVRQVVLQ